MRMSDNDASTMECSWSMTGRHDSGNGGLYLNYGDYLEGGGYNRVSYYGVAENSVLNITGYAEGGTELEMQMTGVDSETGTPEYHTAIAPLVEEVYELCVELPNQAAEGFGSGSLVLNMVIGEDNYTVTFEQEEAGE